MAAPDAPANVAVRPGHNPGDVIVEWDAVTATPAVDYYMVYIGRATGIDSTTYGASKKTTKTRAVFRNKHTWRSVFATVTAVNADDTSADATEASGKARF